MKLWQILFTGCLSMVMWLVILVTAVFIVAWSPRLAGIGCGPEKLIHWAEEEDHFPQCDYIFPINPWR